MVENSSAQKGFVPQEMGQVSISKKRKKLSLVINCGITYSKEN